MKILVLVLATLLTGCATFGDKVGGPDRCYMASGTSGKCFIVVKDGILHQTDATVNYRLEGAELGGGGYPHIANDD